MNSFRSATLPSLLLALATAAVSGCVAYDPYYPSYGSSYGGAVVVPPPAVYAAPPPVVVYPGYRHRSWGGGPGYRHHHGRGWR